MTRHADGGRLLPGLWSVHSNGSIELKAVAFQLVFGTTLLYYTNVKFNQEKNGAGIRRGEAAQAWAVARPRPPLPSVQLKGIRRSDQDFLVWPLRWLLTIFLSGPDSACAQRLLASLTRAGFPRASFPKTVSSTRRQYASMTFASSADIPPVTCISGPNPESVAVRLTIM